MGQKTTGDLEKYQLVGKKKFQEHQTTDYHNPGQGKWNRREDYQR